MALDAPGPLRLQGRRPRLSMSLSLQTLNAGLAFSTHYILPVRLYASNTPPPRPSALRVVVPPCPAREPERAGPLTDMANLALALCRPGPRAHRSVHNDRIGRTGRSDGGARSSWMGARPRWDRRSGRVDALQVVGPRRRWLGRRLNLP